MIYPWKSCPTLQVESYQWNHISGIIDTVIELDDGKILTGKPKQFDGKNPWVSG